VRILGLPLHIMTDATLRRTVAKAEYRAAVDAIETSARHLEGMGSVDGMQQRQLQMVRQVLAMGAVSLRRMRDKLLQRAQLEEGL
jgi:hypothetical protein